MARGPGPSQHTGRNRPRRHAGSHGQDRGPPESTWPAAGRTSGSE